MRLRISAIIASGLLAGTMSAARADTLYVIEQLYVTVNTAPDGTGERVGQIKSGDKVELIERQGDQTHVRLTSGNEGWVKSSYLSADPPLREQVTARTAELEQVRKEKAQLEAELTKARSALAAANTSAKLAAQQAPLASPPGKPTTAPPVNSRATPSADTAPNLDNTLNNETASAEPAAQAAPPLFQDEPMMPTRPSWLVAIAVALLALGVGFALGWRTLDKKIRAKYGGLRIY
jgi:type IV secretory pathway VirJ component